MTHDKIREFAQELLFPRRCIYCNAVVGGGVCTPCGEKLPRTLRPDPLVPTGGRPCEALAALLAPHWYDAPVSTAILRYKFGKYAPSVQPFAVRIARAVEEKWPQVRFDAVVPVPATHREGRGRNCNLPLLLAMAVGSELDVPCTAQVLEKICETPRQMELTGDARRRNLTGAFRVPEHGFVRGKTLLLIDDVLTTGTTLGVCAKTLRKGGAARVYAAAIAVTKF